MPLRKAKIVATLGPSSSTFEMINKLIKAGVDVFRLNFSHGTHEVHKKNIDLIRSIENEIKKPIAILADLQGPKFRIGHFKTPITLKQGQEFILDLRDEMGNEQRVTLPHPEIFQCVKPGATLLLDDGKVQLEIIENKKDKILTKVIIGGPLSDRKGVNIPRVFIPIPALSEKDKIDLEFALSHQVDWVALSFVQKVDDIMQVKELVKNRAGIIAKIEKPMAIDSLFDIIRVSDAVMVARGDLGVELPLEEVPGIQKRITTLSRNMGKPVIVATQMLESMIHSPTPTRAEVSDVATAIYDGMDAVMLSAESASGDYPQEAVLMMDRIIHEVEKDPLYIKMLVSQRPEPNETIPDAITAAAREIAHTINIKVIATYTESGLTTLRAARERPKAMILALTPHEAIARRLKLVWGTIPRKTMMLEHFSEMVEHACDLSIRNNLAQKGQKLIVIAGIPFGSPGTTNILRVVDVE